MFWTPGYWDWGGEALWSSTSLLLGSLHVGFYGGVNYGFGYDGDGFFLPRQHDR